VNRAAFRRALSLIDLRLLCDEDEDYANPIEPSVRGGDKIDSVIAELVSGHAGPPCHSIVLSRAG
jgi:hypothetical protein